MSDVQIKKHIDQGLVVQESGHRKITDDIHLIQQCVVMDDVGDLDLREHMDWYEPEREKHNQQKTYLIDDEDTLLYDNLMPVGTDIILNGLEDVLGDGQLDYVVISHPEANHAGNTHEVLEKYPEATLVMPGSGAHHDLFGIKDIDEERVMFVSEGDMLDLGKHTIEFVEGLFVDHAVTAWMYERTTETLFVADFMGNEHMDGECLKYADEMTVTDTQRQRHAGLVFTWLRFADPDAVDAVIDDLIDRFAPEMIALAHGQVVRKDGIGELEKMKTVVGNIIEREERDGNYDVHTHQMLRYPGRAESEVGF